MPAEAPVISVTRSVTVESLNQSGKCRDNTFDESIAARWDASRPGDMAACANHYVRRCDLFARQLRGRRTGFIQIKVSSCGQARRQRSEPAMFSRRLRAREAGLRDRKSVV